MRGPSTVKYCSPWPLEEVNMIVPGLSETLNIFSNPPNTSCRAPIGKSFDVTHIGVILSKGVLTAEKRVKSNHRQGI
jgi:hypothetical protein